MMGFEFPPPQLISARAEIRRGKKESAGQFLLTGAFILWAANSRQIHCDAFCVYDALMAADLLLRLYFRAKHSLRKVAGAQLLAVFFVGIEKAHRQGCLRY
jgi:hypothetical protein